jgi:hypothetical protein
VNRALLRIIVLRNFVTTYNHRIKENVLGINAVVVSNLENIGGVFGSRMAVKYIGVSPTPGTYSYGASGVRFPSLNGAGYGIIILFQKNVPAKSPISIFTSLF